MQIVFKKMNLSICMRQKDKKVIIEKIERKMENDFAVFATVEWAHILLKKTEKQVEEDARMNNDEML